MATMMTDYNELIARLDKFIRKYYINQLLRGLLYAVGLIVGLFILFTVAEHFFYFSGRIRKGLFYGFVGISAVSLVAWVFLPLLRFFRLGKVISHDQAATIIGRHFPNVEDKLLNVLQLKRQADNTSHGQDLLLAGINQKTESLKPVTFRKAIDLSKNKTYLRYALPPLLLLVVLLFTSTIIQDGTTRIINNDKTYEREAPFTFVIDDSSAEVVQFEDYPLTVKVEGEVLPSEAFVIVDGFSYKLNETAPGEYSHVFKNVQNDKSFYFTANGFDSKEYELSVLKKPHMSGFEVLADYPGYTGRADEIISNVGDMVVPVGSRLTWRFTSEHTDMVGLRFGQEDSLRLANRTGEELFTYKNRILRNLRYAVILGNENLPKADSVSYSVSVIADLYPTINVQSFEDSTQKRVIFFAGDAADDYGIRNLSFKYSVTNPLTNQSRAQIVKPISISSKKQADYTYELDVNELNLKPGDKLSYFFEVADNDAINGSKTARTSVMTFSMPSLEEVEELTASNNEEIKEELNEAMQESKALAEEIERLREKFLQKKELNWQDRQELEKLLEMQKEMQEQLEKAKEKFDQNKENQEEFNQPSEELQEKQEKLNKMFEELMSDEQKEMMKKLEELLEKMDKKSTLEQMEQMEMDDQEFQKNLERLEELFKKLEMEYEMQQTIEKLEELAKKQEELADKVEKNEIGQEQAKKEQEEIKEEFNKLEEKLDELKEKNKDLAQPMEMGDTEQDQQDINEEMNDSQEEMKSGKPQKASESQKGAAEKMKDMAKKMKESMDGGEMEQMEEDMDALRQLMENLITLSFDQEELMNDIKASSINTPLYVELVQEQYKLEDDFKHIEDSLQELSKRVFQIESFVTEKVTEIKRDLSKSLNELEERKKAQASNHQQRTMKSVNDLALMLSEVMDQMQQDMAQKMSGSQMCQNPKPGASGKMPMKTIGDMQQELNEKMKQEAEGQKGEGKKPNKDGKPGSRGDQGEMAKKYAQMAAQQAAIRKALRDYQKELQEQGKGNKELQELMKEMDKIETGLVNKQLTTEMVKRQEQILTRLLEYDKAEREREKEQKRKSQTAQEQERKMPPALEEYLKSRESEVDMYKSVSPSLKPYYKSLVDRYFERLKSGTR